MTRLEKFLIAFILIGLVVMGIWLWSKKTPPPATSSQQIEFNHVIDSVLVLVKERDETILKLNESLRVIDSGRVVVKEKYNGKREVARGADEQKLDSIISSYAR